MDKPVTSNNINTLTTKVLQTQHMDKHYYYQDNQLVLLKKINRLQGIQKYFSQD